MGDRLPRLLVADVLPVAGGEIVLPSDSERHARVLRLTPGAAVVLFDGVRHVAHAVVIDDRRARFTCRAEARTGVPAPEHLLGLIVGVTKGTQLDDVVRMATELGVDHLALALCARTVPTPAGAERKRERLARIALSACAQAGRVSPPELAGPAPLLELAAAAPGGAQRLVFWERARARLPVQAPRPGSMWAVVGPEGGLTETEVAALVDLGYAAVGLGPLILRAQTAAVAVGALLADRMGRLRDRE